MSKWIHRDGCTRGEALLFHELLETIERKVGELGIHNSGDIWGVEYADGQLYAFTDHGAEEIRFPLAAKFGRRTRDWIIDAVIARKAMRKQLNDPTFGATK